MSRASADGTVTRDDDDDDDDDGDDGDDDDFNKKNYLFFTNKVKSEPYGKPAVYSVL